MPRRSMDLYWPLDRQTLRARRLALGLAGLLLGSDDAAACDDAEAGDGAEIAEVPLRRRRSETRVGSWLGAMRLARGSWR
jgi:hypothetical protein